MNKSFKTAHSPTTDKSPSERIAALDLFSDVLDTYIASENKGTDHNFNGIIVQALETLDLGNDKELELSKFLGVSTPTVDRWARGISCALPGARLSVINRLREKVKDDLSNLTGDTDRNFNPAP